MIFWESENPVDGSTAEVAPRGRQRAGQVRRLNAVLCLVLVALLSHPVQAQFGGISRRGSENVRETSEEILSSPEFRRFQRLARPERSGADQFSEGSGGNPGGGGARGKGRSSGKGQRSGERSREDGAGRNGEGGQRSGNQRQPGDRPNGRGQDNEPGNGGNAGRAGGNGDASGRNGDGARSGNGNEGSGGGEPRRRRRINDLGSTPKTPRTPRRTTTRSSAAAGPIGAVFGAIFHGIAWLCLIAVCAVIIFVIVKAIQNYERPAKLKDSLDAKQIDGDVEPERAPGELPADVYLARARELAAEGKFQEAIAHLLLGAMSHIERAGLIKFRRGLTYRDYLRAIRSKETPYQGMRSLVRFYEPIGFGRRDATQETFTQSLTGYEAAVHAGAIAVQS